MCEALLLLSSSSLAGQKHPSLLSRLCPKRRRYKDRFSLNIKIKLSIIFICRHRGCAHSDVRSLNTAIVEAPIERHKSRLASRETGDGFTGTYSGGSLDRTESVPNWSRERRARPDLREAPGRHKAMSSSLLPTHSVRKCI